MLDRSLYPFRSRYHDSAHGRMHYIDEGPDEGPTGDGPDGGAPAGKAPTVLFVHGTPTWSFLFRDLVRELSRDHRVVAVDHLGFGLSDKPEDAPYRPEDHQARLAGLVGTLDLDDITLVVHDFGGPIGLGYALEHPERVRGLVLMNTWMWSLAGTAAEKASRFFSTWIGRFLYTRLNFSPRVLLRSAFANRKNLPRAVHRHYLAPFPDRRRRRAPWAFARELRASSDWFARLWERRDRLAEKPILLLWGMKDASEHDEALAGQRAALRRELAAVHHGSGRELRSLALPRRPGRDAAGRALRPGLHGLSDGTGRSARHAAEVGKEGDRGGEK